MLLILVAALLVLPVLAVPALAHEERKVGDLTFTVGFTPEPAVAGQPIAIELDLEHDGKPAVLTEKELAGITAHLFAGKLAGKTPVAGDYKNQPNQPMPLHATPWIGPGHYESGPFIPTVSGDYTVHVATKDNKTILDGQKVNQLFVTGEETYGPVDNPTSLQFPVKLPTIAEVTTRQAQDAARLATLTTENNAQAEDVSQLKTMVRILGIALAVTIVGGGVLFLSARARRARARHGDQPVTDAG